MEIRPLIKEDFLIVQKDETISSMVGKLKTKEKRNALIFDHDKFLGIVEDKWLMKAKLNPAQTKITKLIKKIPLVNEDIDLIDAAYLMYQSNLNFLPITNGKQISGVVYGLDLIKETAKLTQFKSLKVSHIKIFKTLKLKQKDSISTALSMMFKEHLDQLPFVDKNKLAGIVTFRDILKKYSFSPAQRTRGSRDVGLSTRGFTSERPKIDKLPVDSVGTTLNLATIRLEDPLNKAIVLMHKKNLTDLVVTENDELFGLLLLKNILRKVASLKIPKNFNIKFVGLEKTKLKPYQKYNLKKIASQEAFKLQRGLKNEFNIIVHIKEYEKSGKESKQHKHSVNLKITYPGQTIISDKGKQQGTWDIETALRKAFNNAHNKIKTKFRGDSAWRKPYE